MSNTAARISCMSDKGTKGQKEKGTRGKGKKGQGDKGKRGGDKGIKE